MSENGFGPDGPVATGAAPFSVTGPTSVSLDGARTATVSFSVANVTGRAVRARLLPVPVNGADAAWLSVVGDAERPVGVATTFTADVRVVVAPQAPAGTHGVRLDVAVEDHPDQVTAGQVVTFDVPAPAPRKPFPWWIVVVAVVAVLVLVGGALVIRYVTRDKAPTNTAAPAVTGTAVVGGTVTATPGTWDGGRPIAVQWQSCTAPAATCADIAGAIGATYVISDKDLGRTLRVVEIASTGPADPKTGKAPGPTASKESAPTGVVAPAPDPMAQVPAVSGVPLSEATKRLAAVKLQALQVSSGITGFTCDPFVVSQNPSAGAKVPVGSKVAISTNDLPIGCIQFRWPILLEKQKMTWNF